MSFCLNLDSSAPHSGTWDFRIKAADPMKLGNSGCFRSNSLLWVPKWANFKEMSASFFSACFSWFAFSFCIGKGVYLWHFLLVSQKQSAPICASSGKGFKAQLPFGNKRGTQNVRHGRDLSDHRGLQPSRQDSEVNRGRGSPVSVVLSQGMTG